MSDRKHRDKKTHTGRERQDHIERYIQRETERERDTERDTLFVRTAHCEFRPYRRPLT